MKLQQKIAAGCPEWMQKQIEADLTPYEEKGIQLETLNERFLNLKEDLYIIKYTISNNRVSHQIVSKISCLKYRIDSFTAAFETLCREIGLPDTTFYVFLHDGFNQPEIKTPELINFPLFVMTRATFPGYKIGSILIPDYESLRENYQVLKGYDLTQYQHPWEHKLDMLIWRGSTEEGVFTESNKLMSAATLSEETKHMFSRFTISGLATKFPQLIDAGYSFLNGRENNFPLLHQYKKRRVSFEDQFHYKYHILLNGNSFAFSCSGWKFFTNSLIFIPNSQWSQWYTGSLKAYVHYIPIDANLNNLVNKIEWAKDNDGLAKTIAKISRDFAVNNLTRTDDLVYIYYLLQRYAELVF